jgi:hypothetical protein
MSQYKVLQDVEAEDKLLGPLTLRQFVYAGIAAISLYLCYFTTTRGLGFAVIFFLPIALVTGFFAFPWGKDQPTEVWALAKIRFMIKPRRRIWDQSGVKELVTVTAPKQMNMDYTNGLTQNEVKSRLRSLADTIDSRGWAIKNSNLNLYAEQALVMNEPSSDRLVLPNSMPQQVSNVDVQAADDILDEKNNPRAQRVDEMITTSTKAHRQKIMDNLKKSPEQLQAELQAAQPPTPPAPINAAPQDNQRPGNYWFLNQPSQSAAIPDNMVTFNTQVVTPGMGADGLPSTMPASPDEEEQTLMQQLAKREAELPTKAYYGHLHTIQPLSAQKQQQQQNNQNDQTPVSQPMNDMPTGAPMAPPVVPMPGQASMQMPPTDMPMPPVQTAPMMPQQPAAPPVTPAQQAAILQLASNDDLNVATLAREAQRNSPPDEVVIKLH